MIVPEVASRSLGAQSDARAARALVVPCAAALVAADGAGWIFSVEVSLACYALALFAILTALALVSFRHPGVEPGLVGLALVGTLKLGAGVLPQHLFPSWSWELLPSALALVTVGALMVFGEESATTLRLPARRRPGAWVGQAVIALGGIPLALAAAYVLSAVEPGVSRPQLASARAGLLVAAAVSGLTLEIVFRGVLQPALIAVFGSAGVAWASLLYAGMFLSSRSLFLILLGLISGVVWGLLAARTKSVVGVGASHALFALSWALLR